MRATRVLAAAALALLLAGCGQSAAPEVPAAPPGPDDVASAFAAAYAAGDTPTACTLATGDALTGMTALGWCEPGVQPWPAVSYWPGVRCQFPDGTGKLSGARVYEFRTSGYVAQYPDFVVMVTGTGTTWSVTTFGADGPATRSGNRLCDRYTHASTGPTS